MGQVTVKALSDLNLTIERHSFSLIMGPSGSGKSTLLYLLGGLDRPTHGRIYVADKYLETYDENELATYRRQTVGFIFQSFNLIPTMTALENVAFPMRFTGIGRRQRHERALAVLESVGLADRASHRPTELSGGQQQRVAIARALVNDPAIVLADEPTGNLDTKSGSGIMEVLLTLHQNGTTVVIVSHDGRLADFATRVIHIIDGQIDNGGLPGGSGAPATDS